MNQNLELNKELEEFKNEYGANIETIFNSLNIQDSKIKDNIYYLLVFFNKLDTIGKRPRQRRFSRKS
jgi:hypothetical protein